MKILPFTLVFLSQYGATGENNKSKKYETYILQAICLEKSLRNQGYAPLTILTNETDAVNAVIRRVYADSRINVLEIKASLTVPPNTRFYAAHYKVDAMRKIVGVIENEGVGVLLDCDVVALKKFEPKILEECKRVGLAAYDISDQVFPAYGYETVVNDLLAVSGEAIFAPRWYGGEFLAGTKAGFELLLEKIQRIYPQYVENIALLHHVGDEMFVSAALNLIREESNQVIELGALQVISRHWMTKTKHVQRPLNWSLGCTFVHLPSGKKLLEEEASSTSAFDKSSFVKKIKRLNRYLNLRSRVGKALRRN